MLPNESLAHTLTMVGRSSKHGLLEVVSSKLSQDVIHYFGRSLT